MTNTIRLSRTQYADNGTPGVLSLPDGWACFTIELPWRNNRPNLSCIPEGEYDLRMRPSGVVKHSTHGDYTAGWEVTGVPGRTYIMIHPANYPPELEGCIAPGMSAITMKGYPAVGQSLKAFERLMVKTGSDIGWKIHITGP